MCPQDVGWSPLLVLEKMCVSRGRGAWSLYIWKYKFFRGKVVYPKVDPSHVTQEARNPSFKAPVL